jgi:membrane protein DedA with SNARE-associated domain
VIACVVADWAWYEAGRWKGDRVIHFIHSFTSDPEGHDHRAKVIFRRHGPPILLIAKFVPGLDAVAPPLAGTSGTSRAHFLSFEITGACLWAGAYVALGYFFSDDLGRATSFVTRTGALLVGAVLFLGLIYFVARLVRNRGVRALEAGVKNSE